MALSTSKVRFLLLATQFEQLSRTYLCSFWRISFLLFRRSARLSFTLTLILTHGFLFGRLLILLDFLVLTSYLFIFFLIFITFFIIFFIRRKLYIINLIFIIFLLLTLWVGSLSPISDIFFITAVFHDWIQLFVLFPTNFISIFLILFHYFVWNHPFIFF